MLDKLNKFHLEYIPTIELENLRINIGFELSTRRKKANFDKKRDLAALPTDFISLSRPEIEIKNQSNLWALPSHFLRKFQNNIIFLNALINQDWSHLYHGGDQTAKYYVYAHVNPLYEMFQSPEECGGNWGGRPFYIGKGTGDRAYDLKRNQGHKKIIDSIIENGFNDKDIVRIVFNGLTEDKALEIEAKFIYFFGTIYDKKIRKKGILYNLEFPVIPEFVGQMIDYRKLESIIDDHSTFNGKVEAWDRKHPLASEKQRSLAIKKFAKLFAVKLHLLPEIKS